MRTLVPTLALAALASSCTLNTDYFGDYRGVNLISAYDFGAVGQWDLEPYSAYADPDSDDYDPAYDPIDYMTWASVATEFALTTDGTKSLATGPDGVSPAYRLEIKNLFQDGDFENGQSGSAFSTPDTGWWTSGGVGTTVQFGTGPVLMGGGSFNSIAKTSLFMSGDAGNKLEISLDNAFLSTALYNRKGSYLFWFDFYHATNNTEVFDLSIENQGSSANWIIQDLDASDKTTHLYRKKNLFLLDGATTGSTVTLGGGVGANEAVLDNFRVANTDISPFVVLALPSLSSGTLPLLSGQKTGAYLLKFWVHDDPTADQTGLSGTPNVAHALNRLHPSGISVRVRAAEKSGSGLVEQFVPRPEGGWPTWTQITVPMGFDFVNFDNLIPAGESALDIAFSPTDTTSDSTDVGSLLIAQPSFEFNP